MLVCLFLCYSCLEMKSQFILDAQHDNIHDRSPGFFIFELLSSIAVIQTHWKQGTIP
jgi:hypothetical protein